VARRRDPEPVRFEQTDLPVELRREHVTIEDFVGADEDPPGYWSDTDASRYNTWRQIRALRCWQDAIAEWGVSQGVNARQLRGSVLWPNYPPRLRRSK